MKKLRLKTKLAKLRDWFKKKNLSSIALVKFIVLIFSYGLLINYMLFVVFGVSFFWWGFPAYGIFYYLVKDEFVEWFRQIKARSK